jgi:starch synthase
MKALLATPGRFHIMALARELQRRDSLYRVVSGFPRFSLKRESIEPQLLTTAPFFRTLRFGLDKLRLPAPYDELTYRSTLSVDRAALKILRGAKTLPDVYMALSQTGTASGKLAKELGVPYICDRGSTHILEQQALLLEEFRSHGLTVPPIDPRSIERELTEYETSDLITVPSRFVERSFVNRGVDPKKLAVVPYGANLNMFRPSHPKAADAFHVLFVGALSIRKGIPYLLQAFAKLRHPNKRLTLIGTPLKETEPLLKAASGNNIRILGPVPQVQLAAHMSAAQVLVLPSIEEGFGLVLAEAMACGCPVLASKNTGAENLFDDGEEGFIVEPRDVEALAARMQRMADEPDLVSIMSAKSRARIERIGGWSEYTDRLLGHFARISAARSAGSTGVR